MWGWSVMIRNEAGEWHRYKLPLDLNPDVEAFATAVQAAKNDQGVPEAWDYPWDVASHNGEPDPRDTRQATLHDWTAGIPG